MPIDLAMVAGEASGDLLASLMMRGLKLRFDEIDFHGIGGSRMQAEGFRATWPSDKLAVRGYAEVLLHLPSLLSIRKRLAKQLIAKKPDVFVGVDAPDFNLGLETQLRRAQIPVVHFVSPSIWAWRGERIQGIGRAVDHMLVLFPFEEKIYRDAGIAATYVGHPLADEIPLQVDQAAARQRLGLDTGPVVALMPGSRMAEIHYNGTVFAETARLLLRMMPNLQFVTPTASAATREKFIGVLDRIGARSLRIKILDGQSHEALGACDAALIASGTATLEAALYKRPMVVAYRMAALSYSMMKNKGYLPWVALPNILAREFLVPEFIQHEATPEVMAAALMFQLQDEGNREHLGAAFADMHHLLRRDTAARSAEVIADVIKSRSRRP